MNTMPNKRVSRETTLKYFQILRQQVEILENAVREQNWQLIREVCHRLRGSAGLFGLSEVEQKSSLMEKASERRTHEEVQSCLHALQELSRQGLSSAA